MKHTAARLVTTALAIGGILAGCTPNRTRPGPPRVTIDIPGGTNVTSPDTFTVEVLAVDADGLDSLNIRWGNEVIDINTGFNVEAGATVELMVPANLNAGTVLTVLVRARDIFAQTTDEMTSLTVIP